MAKSKRQHRKGLARAKSLVAPRRVRSNSSNDSDTRPTATAAAAAAARATRATTTERVRPPYVSPYEEGPEQNAFVESMRVHGAQRAAAARPKDTKTLWAEWFATDPALRVLGNTTRPIGAWADLMEEEYKKNPALLKPRRALVPSTMLEEASAAAASAAEAAEAVPAPVPVVRGPRLSTRTQLLVGNLPAGITASQLVVRFEPYGAVTDIKIPIDPGTKYTKGFAFLTFSEPEGAAAALRALQGTLTFPNPLKKGPKVLLATLAYAEGKPKSKQTMRARGV